MGNAVANSQPTEAELERRIREVVRLGLDDAARTLSPQLEDRRRATVPANVVPFRKRVTS